MSKYTAEQAYARARLINAAGYVDSANMLNHLGDLLRERESAKAAVTDAIVDAACSAVVNGDKYSSKIWNDPAPSEAKDEFRLRMRAALEAVAPMLASAPCLELQKQVEANGDFSILECPDLWPEWIHNEIKKAVDEANARVPVGWQIVPKELTREMVEAFGNAEVPEPAKGRLDYYERLNELEAEASWHVMLAAAPKPEEKS